MRRLEAVDSVKGGWDTDAASSVGANGNWDDAEGDGRGSAGRRTTGVVGLVVPVDWGSLGDLSMSALISDVRCKKLTLHPLVSVRPLAIMERRNKEWEKLT